MSSERRARVAEWSTATPGIDLLLLLLLIDLFEDGAVDDFVGRRKRKRREVQQH